MDIEHIHCAVCGFRNPTTASRCRSCGAKLEVPFNDEPVTPAILEGFSWRWTMIALGVFFALEVVLLGVLPFVMPTYDPQGLPAMMVAVAIWFVGGIVMGFISPPRHFLEPVAASCLIAVPTIAYIALITPKGFEPTTTAYAVSGVMGIVSSMFGALLGERIKVGAPRPVSES